jgi:hypothetical protein
MASQTAIPALETRIFRAYWQDGALDLAAGLALMFAAVLWLLGAKVGIAIAPAIGLAAFPILRKRITEPRMGSVRFNESRRSKLRRAQLMALVGGAVALAAVLALVLLRNGATSGASLEQTIAPGIPAALVALMSLIAAAMLGLVRFVVYALALLACAAVVIIIDGRPAAAELAGGVIVTVTGAVLMRRFAREYPIVPGDME